MKFAIGIRLGVAAAIAIAFGAGCTVATRTVALGFCSPPAAESRPWIREATLSPTTLVVFVHGFCGDSRQTWTAGTFYFPEALAAEFRDADFMSFEYARGVDDAPGVPSIVSTLHFEISARAHRNYKRIKFIGHSLGGLVVREYVLSHPEVPVTHVILLSSPSDGAELATTFSRVIPKNRQAADLELLSRNSYLRSLNDRWESTFVVENHPRYVEVYGLFEEVPTFGVGVIVSEASATKYVSPPSKLGVQRTHIDIAKPKDQEDRIYRWVKNSLSSPPRPAIVTQPKSNEGRLVAADDPMPPSACPSSVPSDSSAIFFGDSVAYTNRFPFEAIRAGARPLVTINKDSAGAVLLTADIRGDDGKIVARIVDGEFTVNQNNILSMKRPDASTLIVVDQYGREAIISVI